MIVIVNYGVGNLHSVKKAFKIFDNNVIISDKSSDIMAARKIILPGVGHFKDVMERIKRLQLLETLIEAGKDKPFLGICLGMQILFEESEEGNKSEEGNINGLSLIKGRVVRFPNNLKVPHIGWNKVNFKKNPFFGEIPEKSWFYFVHSYYPIPNEPVTIAVTDYGNIEFASVVSRDNIIGCQFHPEKSGKIGLKLIENFVKL